MRGRPTPLAATPRRAPALKCTPATGASGPPPLPPAPDHLSKPSARSPDRPLPSGGRPGSLRPGRERTLCPLSPDLGEVRLPRGVGQGPGCRGRPATPLILCIRSAVEEARVPEVPPQICRCNQQMQSTVRRCNLQSADAISNPQMQSGACAVRPLRGRAVHGCRTNRRSASAKMPKDDK